MQLLGVGLSRTGTNSLADALNQLGYRTIHWAPERLRDVVDGNNQTPDFRRYDDVDAVTDIPAAYFFRELWRAYPDLRFILTWRDPDEWFQSVRAHYARIPDPDPPLQTLVYGSTHVTEFLYKKRFWEHRQAVEALIPPSRLLILDITAGDGWEPLCRFLNRPIPQRPFPHHRSLPA